MRFLLLPITSTNDLELRANLALAIVGHINITTPKLWNGTECFVVLIRFFSFTNNQFTSNPSLLEIFSLLIAIIHKRSPVKWLVVLPFNESSFYLIDSLRYGHLFGKNQAVKLLLELHGRLVSDLPKRNRNRICTSKQKRLGTDRHRIIKHYGWITNTSDFYLVIIKATW